MSLKIEKKKAESTSPCSEKVLGSLVCWVTRIIESGACSNPFHIKTFRIRRKRNSYKKTHTSQSAFFSWGSVCWTVLLTFFSSLDEEKRKEKENQAMRLIKDELKVSSKKYKKFHTSPSISLSWEQRVAGCLADLLLLPRRRRKIEEKRKQG